MELLWRDIAEAPAYKISNTGIIANKKTGHVMKIFIKGRKYPTVALFNYGRTIQRFVHRLVAFAFILNDDPDWDTVVHHKDSNPMNFRWDNLTWCSQFYNVWISHKKNVGDTNIDRMKKTLCSPVVELDMDRNVICEYKTPQGTGYHCKELYRCLKAKIPFRGKLYLYKHDLDKQ